MKILTCQARLERGDTFAACVVGAGPMRRVPVLFCASSRSPYVQMADADPWPLDRDARLWLGRQPVIAHPPCRSWSKFRRFAKPRCDEADLARFAVLAVRAFGGVLEHPEGSALWADMDLPRPGAQGLDQAGGFSISVDQSWWGHSARKRTWLYIVGLRRRDVLLPFSLSYALRTVESLHSADRELTPASGFQLPAGRRDWPCEPLTASANIAPASGRRTVLPPNNGWRFLAMKPPVRPADMPRPQASKRPFPGARFPTHSVKRPTFHPKLLK